MSAPVVDVLTFEGCPNAEPALELVKRVVADIGIAAKVRRVDIADTDQAQVERFLGSPTIRVNGRDIDPGVPERAEYVLSCRIYRTECGVRGQPDERWLRVALEAAV